ncbi:MAG: cation-translocating P-type ATPase, partial [Bacteroidaceae bacterium]
MKQEFSYKGLNDAQVAESRSKHGSNILTPPTKTPVWKQFLEKFRDPLIVILLIAGVLSICISIYEHLGLGKSIEVFFEPVGIFVAIFLATGLAFYFEYKAGKEFDILNRINDDEPVEVVRNGNVTRIARRNVVVGDLVLINTGEEIAADGELLQSVRLQIDESSLTGEPICIKSCREEDFDPEATYPTNHVLKGTKVMEGHGKMIVTAVGDKTEQGKVFVASQIDDGKKTPFNEQLDRLGVWISRLSYAIAFAIVVCRIILYLLTYGTDFFDSFQHATPFIAYVLQTLMIAVTLIVVAVPEGLPMAITLSLAYSMRRMLKTNNLVRKLHSCETMGATTVICTDKTGTLTQNRMKVNSMKIFNTNVPHELICEGIAVNSTASIDFTQADKPQVMGNPTEGALLMWLINNGTDYRTIRNSTSVVEELPFTTERKYMATVVNSTAMPGKKILYIKGAPEIVFEMSDYKADDKTEVYKQLDDFQRHAMRTLGFAYKILAYDETPIINDTITSRNISFIGVAAISDPVRTDVANAIKECTNAGINIKIVTGDTPLTAMEIGRQIGLWTNRDNESSLISGTEFAALSDKELSERVEKLKIIARARPMDKKRL